MEPKSIDDILREIESAETTALYEVDDSDTVYNYEDYDSELSDVPPADLDEEDDIELSDDEFDRRWYPEG